MDAEWKNIDFKLQFKTMDGIKYKFRLLDEFDEQFGPEFDSSEEAIKYIENRGF